MQKPAPIVTYTFFDRPYALRRPANRTVTSHLPVLAAFDPDSAIIWANDELRKIAERNRNSMRVLRDEDAETIAHEFARALKYRDILQDHASRAERVAALRKRRARLIMRSTAESYANRKLAEEREAEEVVQRIRMEILNSFDCAQRGSGLRTRDIGTRAEESADGIVNKLRRDYLDSAKREFVRLHGTQSSTDGDIEEELAYRDQNLKVLKLNEIRWLFPTKLSPTLADQVDEIISFGIDIVISPSEGS